METVRYIQAADLHLDAPFTGIAQSRNRTLSELLKDATFKAAENLVLLCENEKPDFLLLAGDIYDSGKCSVRAQLRLRDLCLRLEKLGILVFICHGNHDPWQSRLTSLAWPDNVTIFGPQAGAVVVTRNGLPIALVHGASHAGANEDRNLARLIQRDPAFDTFQIGLLHCNVDGAVNDRYAPCSLEDLKQANLDAWALGHAHERKTLCEHPLIIYPGNTQGLNVNETGQRGCYLATATYEGESWHFETRFVELSPIRWQSAAIDLDGASSIGQVMDNLQEAVQQAADSARGSAAVILNLKLTGRTALDRLLHNPATVEDLLAQLEPAANGSPPVWIHDLRVDTGAPLEQIADPDRDDLLGEVARVSSKLEQDFASLEKMAQKSLEPLYGNRRYARLLTLPDQDGLLRLLAAARRTCFDVLEGR